MKCLGIDTSGSHLTVAIINEDKIYSKHLPNCNLQHSVIAMQEVEDLLLLANLDIFDIDVFACVVGPGSFTGIRIGVSTAKALGYAKNKPVLGVTSFDTLAYNIDSGKVLAVVDAKHGNYYVCAYKNGEVQTKPAFMTEAQIKSEFSDFQAISSQKLENFDNFVASLPSGLTNAISALNKNCTHHENCYPLYVKRSQAEEELC